MLDFGERHFEVIHTAGQSPGSSALWGAASGVLFSGDTGYDWPLVSDAWHSSLDDYVFSTERLNAVPVRTVHGGHLPSFGCARRSSSAASWTGIASEGSPDNRPSHA